MFINKKIVNSRKTNRRDIGHPLVPKWVRPQFFLKHVTKSWHYNELKLVIWNGPFEWFDCFCNTPNLDDNDLKRGIWSVTFDCIWCVCVCVYIYIYIYVKTKTFLKTQRECLICIFKQQFLIFKHMYQTSPKYLLKKKRFTSLFYFSFSFSFENKKRELQATDIKQIKTYGTFWYENDFFFFFK